MLKEISGANLNLVEEPQCGQEIANLLGNHVDAIICTMAEVAQYVASGDFKILAVASGARNKTFPNVPTFNESGYDIEVGTWRGFMVPEPDSRGYCCDIGIRCSPRHTNPRSSMISCQKWVLVKGT